MNEKEIREHFAAHTVENQVEFEAWMAEINATQFGLVEPYDTRLRDITKRRSNIVAQKSALNIQLDMLKQERATVEDERRQICAVFHELKHAMIQLNPREKFVKEQNADPRPDTEDEILESLKAKRNDLQERLTRYLDDRLAASSADLSREDRPGYDELWDMYAKVRCEIREMFLRLPRTNNGQPSK